MGPFLEENAGNIGSLVGAAAGSIIPGVGTVLGGMAGKALGNAIGGAGKNSSGGQGQTGLNPGAVSLGLGALQSAIGAIRQKKANEMFPANEDPELRALATNAARRKRAYQTGTAMNSQAANIQALNKQGINAAFNAGGGMAGINRIAQITNQAMLGLNNQSLQGELAFGQQEAEARNRLIQTRLEKSLLRYNQAQADAKQMKTNANRNLMYGLARSLPLQQVDPMYSNSSTIPSTATPGINPNPQNLQNG